MASAVALIGAVSMSTPRLVVGTNDLPLSIGTQDDGPRSYEGAVDELHLFNFALSELEIQDLMQL